MNGHGIKFLGRFCFLVTGEFMGILPFACVTGHEPAYGSNILYYISDDVITNSHYQGDQQHWVTLDLRY